MIEQYSILEVKILQISMLVLYQMVRTLKTTMGILRGFKLSKSAIFGAGAFIAVLGVPKTNKMN